MADNFAIPEGVHIPVWYRRLLEARATEAGPADVPPPPPPAVNVPPPPVAEVPLPPPPQHPQADFAKTCKDFKAMGGKNFQGTETFVEARNWLKETEDLFAIFGLDDQRKILLAVWLMKDEAAYWWEVTNGTRPVETWADFRARFMLKFLSSAEENLQMERFITLKQGDMSVKEYVNKFNQLARFGLDMVNTPQKKALRFARGLNEPLQGLAMSHIPHGATFESLVDMALLQGDVKKEIKMNDTQAKKTDSQWKGNQGNPSGQSSQGNKNKNKGKNNKRKCHYCGSVGHLIKDCKKRKRKNGECFFCGETGHFSKDCPKKQGQGQGQTQRAGPSGGQVHALNTAPVPDRGSISVESLVYISDFPVRTLFDFGASHSLFHLV